MPMVIIEDSLKRAAFRDSIDVLVDGLSRGRFHPNGCTEIRIDAGDHTIRLRINNRQLLPVTKFILNEREAITFECVKVGFWRPKLKFTEKHKRIHTEQVMDAARFDAPSAPELDPLKIYGEIHRRHRW